MWTDVAEKIRVHQNFVLTTHINTEGDAIGSEIALAAFFEGLGKNVTIMNSSPTPQNSVFMDTGNRIKVYSENYDAKVVDGADIIMILDVNNWAHVGPFADVIRASGKTTICIDHHQGAENGFADIMVNDTSAAAAGMMIYDLIRHMRGEITPEIATAVYASIITDTGTFRFSNTDERVFQMAAELTRVGVDPFSIHR